MPSYYEKVHGWFDWENLYKSMVEKYRHNGRFVEIGCYKGKSSTYLAELIMEMDANIHVDFIDPWSHENVWSELDKGRSIEDIYQEFLTNLFAVTKRDSRFKVIRNRSQLEAINYSDQSLDFVYVDGDHDPEQMAEDVLLFLPKIKIGGTIAGHDRKGKDVEAGLHLLETQDFKWYPIEPNSWRSDVN